MGDTWKRRWAYTWESMGHMYEGYEQFWRSMKGIDTKHDGKVMTWGNNGRACGIVSEGQWLACEGINGSRNGLWRVWGKGEMDEWSGYQEMGMWGILEREVGVRVWLDGEEQQGLVYWSAINHMKSPWLYFDIPCTKSSLRQLSVHHLATCHIQNWAVYTLISRFVSSFWKPVACCHPSASGLFRCPSWDAFFWLSEDCQVLRVPRLGTSQN